MLKPNSAINPFYAAKVYRSSFIPGLHDVCMIFEHSGQQEGVCL